MSNRETHRQDTQHAFLVAWGWFAEHIGLIQQLQAVSLKQKHYHHRPQTKVLEHGVAGAARARQAGAPGWGPDWHSRFQY